MAADASAKSPYLGDQLIAVQSIKIAINIHGSGGYAAHSAASDPDLRKRIGLRAVESLVGRARAATARLSVTSGERPSR